MSYNVNNRPIIIFNAIEDLSQLATAANLEISQQQIMRYRVELLKSTGEFDTTLTSWFYCPPADTTWVTFKKTLFRSTHISYQN